MTANATRKSYLSCVQFARLEHACSVVAVGLGHPPYLVGTATESSNFRDVDLRVIMPDDEFDRLFTKPDDGAFPGGLWGLLCLAVGQYLSDVTGLPIDFQIQRMTEANEKFGGKARNPMGHGFRTYAGGGDATKISPALAAPPDAEKIDHIPSHTSPPTDGVVYVQIDRISYRVNAGTYSGKRIRTFVTPNIADRSDLWLVVPGENDRLIDLGERVDIRTSGLRFFTAPKLINPGAPPDPKEPSE